MKTILVVDDVSVCREFVATALQRAGYKTLCAADGVEALAQLEAGPVDLVVLDFVMPKLGGTAFMRAVRADARFPALPVILLTSKNDRESIVQARLLGVQDYLLKAHFNVAELLVRVKQHIVASGHVPPSNGPGAALLIEQ